MLTKNTIKNITALHQKKFRREEKLFIAEGDKVVCDLLASGWNVIAVYGTQDFFQKMPRHIQIAKHVTIELVTEIELNKISALATPQHVLAVAEIPSETFEIDFEKGLKLVFDDIRDPGNLGTLMRIADWFGINDIICSPGTVECTNPKVVQASMGSLFRINIIYHPLADIFNENILKNKLPVYGTVLDGNNLYKSVTGKDGFILVGNESEGISNELLPFVTDSITIPSFSGSKADSLNVAVATGIICSEFRRNN